MISGFRNFRSGRFGLGKLYLFLGGIAGLFSACSHQVKGEADEEQTQKYDYLDELVNELVPEPVYVESDVDPGSDDQRQDEASENRYRMQSCRKGYVQGSKKGGYMFINKSECFVLSSISVDGAGNPLNGENVRAIGFRSRRGVFKDWYPIPARIEDGKLADDHEYAEKVMAFVKKDRDERKNAKDLLAADVLSDPAIKRYKRNLDDFRMLPTLAYGFADNDAVFLFDGEHEMKNQGSFIEAGDVFVLHLDSTTRNARVYRLNKGKQDAVYIGNWNIDIYNNKLNYRGTGEI